MRCPRETGEVAYVRLRNWALVQGQARAIMAAADPKAAAAALSAELERARTRQPETAA